ncbi:putative ribosome biogenesis gtp-binding protein [Diplogelasinospora grovesii]|uniref:Ribosome biogenesis gtp-binding protein n=1 Tax=Diplogelasinospora grovesii TaxID=303347 RepID=A0AAN6N9T8_9PEZI|nr:putative ribosome biogenesis gtp-binding protein [Diplogelasinospora grovesii]
MRSITPATFLAMPPALRSFVLEASILRPCTSNTWTALSRRALSTSHPPTRSPPSPPPQALSYLPAPSNDPNQHAIPAPPVSEPNLLVANTIFTSLRPRFLYAAPRFLYVPVNTQIPEVCVLGRSNVGKSTLINALAGLDGSLAGRSHGATAKRAGQAITSSKAGSTKTMNAYGFGPPLQLPKPPKPKDTSEEDDSARRLSRTEKRAEHKKAQRQRERPPAHSLILMDMPGYGLNSQKEWGVEITKYLSRRAMLRGAVLLVDAVAGIKDGDRMALNMLRDANVRTAIVLTKADKLVMAQDQGVNDMCLSVWEELRRIERRSLTWLEGTEKGWEREIWVTGAGDPKSTTTSVGKDAPVSGGLGVAGARLAICRMAGLVQDDRGNLLAPQVVKEKVVSKVVPFDQIQWQLPEKEEPRRRLHPSF